MADADRHEFDVVVLGSGVAGLTAALTATLEGLSAVVLEHTAAIGGTSARSSGSVWVPDNHHIRAKGILDDRGRAESYLEGLVSDRGDAELWHAFLDEAPRMALDLEERAAIAFRPLMGAPDYRQEINGAASGGRPLEPLSFDGRRLGTDFLRLAWPLPELMLFGGLMITRAEAATLLRADRSPRAALFGAHLISRYLADRLRWPRGARLVLGNALVARIWSALKDQSVAVWTDAKVCNLIRVDSRIAGVELEGAGSPLKVTARRAVILAGGGFPASAAWRERLLPDPVAAHTPAAPGADGSTLDLALAAGASLGPGGLDNALWFPSSLGTRRDGSTMVYPHIVLDRAKPGLIAVDQAGRRFANEATSYHEFVRAMYRAHSRTAAIPAWLICDRAFIRHYGLGAIRPRSPSVRRHVESGYLREAATLEDLATALGIARTVLSTTVERFNGFAESGIDIDFRRGESAYDRSNGDPSVSPNPCLGPIRVPPYYALKVWPTPLGTSRGLRCDASARVCDAAGEPIPGLYASGNDMQSVFGGEYPGAGAELGQAMTFSWIAARHIAGRG